MIDLDQNWWDQEAKQANTDEATGLTWTCHICGDERPDKLISVLSYPIFEGAKRNVRYCNDRVACLEGAALKALNHG